MVEPAALTTTPGANAASDGQLPARSLSGKCDLDPCGDWVVELLKGAYEGSPPTWPMRSRGMQALVKSDRLLREIDKEQVEFGRPSAALDLQEALRRQLTRQADAPHTAIQVHAELDGLISAAKEVICTYKWFLEPSSAVLICAGPVEASAIEALLRRDNDLERGVVDDLLESARWVAEELMAPCPGWRYSGPAPVLLADQLPPDARWREVFLSPGCRGLQADQLSPVVRAAEVGVHLVSA